MKKIIITILLSFIALGITSCSTDDEPLADIEQTIQAANSTDPIPEHEGEDEELEPNP